VTSSDWQADVALNDAFPFADFVWSLRNLDVPVGVHDLQSVAKLLGRWPGMDRDELRDALAALLARRPSDLPRIRKAFEEWFPVEEPPVEPPPEPEKKRVRKIAPWAAAAALALIAIAVAVWWPRPTKPITTTPQVTTTVEPPPQKTVEVDRSKPPAPPPLPPQPHRPAQRYPWLASVLAMLVILAGAAELRARRGRRKAAGRAAAEELAGMRGPNRYDPVVKPAGPPLPPSWVKDAATIIGRGVEEGAASEDLDVDETLRETLRAGLRPVLVFQPPPRRAAILVLEDTAPAMRPWAAKVGFLLTELVREGIAVERWFFDSDPTLVAPERHGRRMSLERLADTRSDRALLVVSAGEALDAVLRQRRRLTATLRRWSYRSWLNPIPNPRLWAAALRHAPMNVWPLTGNGLQRAAWEIAAGPYATPSMRAEEKRREVTADDVERLKRLIALVPYPTVALAEELRRRYCPDIPEEVVVFLAADGTLRGERLLLPDDEVRRLLAAQRHDAPVRESRVRRYLLEVLGASRPAEGSVADLRWQIDRALQEVHASAAAGSEPLAGSVAQLESLAGGPLANEVRKAAALTGAPDAIRQRVERAAARYAARAQRLAPRWAMPGVLFLILAAVLAYVAYRAAVPVAAGKGEAIPHLIGAYRLDYKADPNPTAGRFGTMLIERVNPAAPAQPRLRIGNSVLAAASTSEPVDGARTGVFWRAEGSLGQGNLALSENAWVPKMRFVSGDGTIVINLLDDSIKVSAPVRLISTERGSEITVQSFTETPIPAGEWQFQVNAPGYKPLAGPTTVTAGRQTVVSAAMVAVAPPSLFGELSIVAPGIEEPSEIYIRAAGGGTTWRWRGGTERVLSGIYIVSWSSDFYDRVEQRVDLVANRTARVVFASRTPQYGVVVVNSNPPGAMITHRGTVRVASFISEGYRIIAPQGPIEVQAETQLGAGKATIMIVAGKRIRATVDIKPFGTPLSELAFAETTFQYMGYDDQIHQLQRASTGKWVDTGANGGRTEYSVIDTETIGSPGAVLSSSNPKIELWIPLGGKGNGAAGEGDLRVRERGGEWRLLPTAPNAPRGEPKPSVMRTTAVTFDRGSARISSEQQGILDTVASWMKEAPKATVVLTGYADSPEPEALSIPRASVERTLNPDLANIRAEAVRDDLIHRYGIDQQRITVKESTGLERRVTITVTIP